MTEEPSKLKRIALAIARRASLAVIALVALAVGFGVRAALTPPGGAGPDAAADAGKEQLYTCSMHPSVRLKDPKAKCPICAMDLIPVTGGDAGGSLRAFQTSEAAAALMDIETALVQREFVTAGIRMVGKVDYDETKLTVISSWMPGRLDRMFIDYTGVSVRKGDHLVSIYSPDLLAAQEELIQAQKAVAALKNSDVGVVREATEATLTASEEKLRLLGLTDKQIAAVKTSGKVADHLTIYSPAAGIVIEKHAKEGQYVQTGTRLYTIADLSTMWVKLDAYESDLVWLRYGQEVTFTAEAYPGDPFTGTIAFVDPVLDPQTRTVKVRVNVPNKDGRLKPGMFVKAVVHSQVAAGGRVMDAALAGKWISPHHPEIVKDKPGVCDICGVPLVRAETLGYVGPDAGAEARPLVVPTDAALMTGTRAVVYVEVDPSRLRLDSVRDWPALVATIKAQRRATGGGAGGFANRTCPIMGSPITPANVTPDLVREFQGKRIAFCCAGCPEQWDKLSNAQKAEKLGSSAKAKVPAEVFWKLLSADLRKKLLEVKPTEAPPIPVRHEFVAEVNRALTRRDLVAMADWPVNVLDSEARGLILQGADDLPPKKLTRLNRLLVVALFPSEITRGTAGPTFEGREVLLGPRAGAYRLVRAGLTEGQRVVTRGAFKIDSALQIKAKPSMMSPEGSAAASGHAHHGAHGKGTNGKGKDKDKTGGPKVSALFKYQLRGVLSAGQEAKAAAKAGHVDHAHKAFAKLGKALKTPDQTLLDTDALLQWKELSMRLTNDAVEGSQAKTARDLARAADSLSQNLMALRMRMALSGLAPGTGIPAAFLAQLKPLYEAYYGMHRSLAGDDQTAAIRAASAGGAALKAVDDKPLSEADRAAWQKAAAELAGTLSDAAGAKNIEGVRQKFALLSEKMVSLAGRFGVPPGLAAYRMKCPMAFDNRGAIWLQGSTELTNPYFGSAMPRCGTMLEVLATPDDSPKPKEAGDHGDH